MDEVELERRPLSPVDAALVAEACSKSDLVWLRPAAEKRPRAAWHVWHEDAVCVVTGGGEQELPALEGPVEVIARSKDTGSRIVSFVAEAERLMPGAPGWEEITFALSAARLNGAAPAEQRKRWAQGEARIVLLRPAGVTGAGPGDDGSPSGAAPPPGGPGTTLTRRPFHAGGRRRRAARMRRDKGEPTS